MSVTASMGLIGLGVSASASAAASVALNTLSEEVLSTLAQDIATADAPSEYCYTSIIFTEFALARDTSLFRTGHRPGTTLPFEALAHLLRCQTDLLPISPWRRSFARFLPSIAGVVTAEGTLAAKNFFGLQGRGATILFGTALMTSIIIQCIEATRTGNREAGSSWGNILLGTGAAAGAAWMTWHEDRIGAAALAAAGFWLAGAALFTAGSRWWIGRKKKHLEALDQRVRESLTPEVMKEFFAQHPYHLQRFLGDYLPTLLRKEISKQRATIQQREEKIRSLERKIERANANSLLGDEEKMAFETRQREKIQKGERRTDIGWRKIEKLQTVLGNLRRLQAQSARVIADTAHLRQIEEEEIAEAAARRAAAH